MARLGAGALIGVLAVAAAGGIAALPSCNAIPEKTCYGDRVNADLVGPEGKPDPECTACLQQSVCCDRVGRCQEDQRCREDFPAIHACIIDGGPTAESKCKDRLNPAGRELYACMRQNCGTKCTVPSCDVDPSVVLFQSASCDRCMGAACCEAINDCYGDRRCKLIAECVLRDCRFTLGQEMSQLAAVAPVIPLIRQQMCGEGADAAPGEPPPDAEAADVSACINRCLQDFAPEIDAGGTADDNRARCLAFRVYACGAESSCGPQCIVDAGAAPPPPEQEAGTVTDAATD